MTVESSANVDMEMHNHEKKHEDQLCDKIHDQTYKIKSEEESELSIKDELSEQCEENGKHIVRENEQGMREKEVCAQEKELEVESIINNEELMIHYDDTNNFNHSFSSVLKVLLQDFKPYEDLFDDIVEIPYAYKVKSTFDDFIHRVKFKMKHQEFLPYEFIKTNSTFEVINQIQFNLQFIKFVFDLGGLMD